MSARGLLVVVVSVVLLGACVRVQQPYRFSTDRPRDGLTAEVARALVVLGLVPGNVDERTGIVTTLWRDLHVRNGVVNGSPAYLVRRYVVSVAPYPSGALVQVRMDAKRCREGGFTADQKELHGACEAMDDLPDAQQTDVDALGVQLESALAQHTNGRAPAGL